MKNHYLPENSKTLICAQTPFSNFDHDCRMPDAGLVLVGDRQQSKNVKEPNKSYHYATMVVIKPTSLQKFKEDLKDHGIETNLEIKF